MNRTVVGAAQLAAGALMALAVLPVVLAGTAHAADAPTPGAVAYADQVGIGTAVKIGNPAAVGRAAAASHPATDSAEDAAAAAKVTATPSGAVVIETESHQATDPTEVAVLGTKVGSKSGSTTGTDGTLAQTGPSTVTIQALVALMLILAGAALKGGPQLAVVARRGSARRH